VHGKHSVTFGFQLQRLQDNNARPTSGTSASFSFSNTPTAGFSPTGTLLSTTGNSFASYLLGGPDSASITQNYVVWNGARYHDYSAFVQDDWAVLPHLTLNLGVRWDLFGPSKEAFNRMSFMNPNMPNPAAGGRLGALEYAGSGPVNCNCDVPIRPHYHNFEPRLGVAWSPNSKTVIRTGFLVNFSHGAAGIGGNGSAAGSGSAHQHRRFRDRFARFPLGSGSTGGSHANPDPHSRVRCRLYHHQPDRRRQRGLHQSRPRR
jgi:outer membrane receptor protein involved in Fe transport